MNTGLTEENIKALARYRQRGDYDDFVYSTLEEVEELYPKAQTFIEEVDVLLGQ